MGSDFRDFNYCNKRAEIWRPASWHSDGAQAHACGGWIAAVVAIGVVSSYAIQPLPICQEYTTQNTRLIRRKVNCCEGINRVVVDALVPTPKSQDHQLFGPRWGEGICQLLAPIHHRTHEAMACVTVRAASSVVNAFVRASARAYHVDQAAVRACVPVRYHPDRFQSSSRYHPPRAIIRRLVFGNVTVYMRPCARNRQKSRGWPSLRVHSVLLIFLVFNKTHCM
jgi:hypothetical protein